MGLTTDPAATIHFDEDPNEKTGNPGKKKISLVDYFYVKVISVQQPVDNSTIAVFNNQACHASASRKTSFCLWRSSP